MDAQQGDTTLAHARNLARSVASSRTQSAALLAALAAVSLAGNVPAALAAAAGAALVAMRRADAAPARPPGSGLALGHAPGAGLVGLDAADALGHVLFEGPCAAGRVGAMLGVLEGALASSSGFILCDGRGDVSVIGRVHALAAKHGRLDDLLVLNLAGGPSPHAFNPFRGSPPAEVARQVSALLDDPPTDATAWRARERRLLASVAEALSSLPGGVTPRSLLEALPYQPACSLAGSAAVAPSGREAMTAYLRSIPGFQPDRGPRQSQAVADLHGHLAARLCDALAPVAEACDSISGSPEMDLADVISGRRVLVALLPPVWGPADPAAAVGLALTGAIRVATDAAPGRGSRRRHPFLCCVDAVGTYGVEGLVGPAASAAGVAFILGNDAAQPETRKTGSTTAATRVAVGRSALPSPSLGEALGTTADGQPPSLTVTPARGGAVQARPLSPSTPPSPPAGDALHRLVSIEPPAVA